MLTVIVVTAVVTGLLVIIGLNFATPEKQLERKVDHHYAVSDPQFRREMGVLLGPAILPGNTIKDLQNGDEIFPAMLEAIRGARKTISFETYIYWEGDVGKQFADALSERAKAGVQVHVTIDWAGSFSMEEDQLKEMEDAGVQVQRYRPLHWYNLARLNNRTHRKLLIVDGRTAFTGGVGIGDPWRGNAEDPDHWRDMHFRVEGPVVAQFQAAFNDNWIKTTGRVLNGTDNFPALTPVNGMDAHMFISSPNGGSESMHLMYLMAIAAAEQSIDLEAAYFIPDQLITTALLEARKRNVRIRVIVPGENTDSDAARHASRRDWGPMLKAGIEISEYAPTMFHNKMLIVDKEVVSVGSTNFDLRSFRLNDEASLNVYDKAFAERMTEIFEQDLGKSKRYTYETWEKRPLKEKFMETFVLPIKSQL
ncbi:phospholipase D-like domain-containing protein [Lysobacter sp. A6]|uniref:Phospholipase D-like domain-containing protein n=1 Tax=Noviluteimonas lactosilytica TaxID=2888523 RepID=A0ABS8JDV5_9GAMM|nr:phospholipase D-like domain-containing protein [Lysobacter lactosilyticus]MCC8361784.1 phospholipase D-like domain-containing protein [Lysobacter lactosilyticus]